MKTYMYFCNLSDLVENEHMVNSGVDYPQRAM